MEKGNTDRDTVGEGVNELTDGYVATYMRISDDDTDVGKGKNESGSISNQRDVLQHFINAHEELSRYPVREFFDDGYSGVNFNRPGIQNLFKEVRENRVACIVVKDLSRFGRNYIEVGDYIEQIFPFMGVRFIAISDNYDSFKSSGGIEVGFRNLIHDLYSRDLSKKIKSVKRIYQEKGFYTGGGVPYGYAYSGKGKSEKGQGIYQPDPDAAEVVKNIFLLAASGNTPTNIAKRLNDEGIPTPGLHKKNTGQYNYRTRNEKRNLWYSAKIREILQNEAYIGTYICHKGAAISPREMRRTDKSEYLRFENAHEVLVSEYVFDAAQKVTDTQGKRGRYKKEDDPHALQGKVRCGCCGYSMKRNGKEATEKYFCRMGDSCGSHIQIKVQDLDNTVLEILKRMVSIQREAEQKKEESRRKGLSKLLKIREEKRILEMKAEHCRSSRLLLYRQWKEQQIAKEEYIKKRDEYTKLEEHHRERMAVLEERLERLSAQQAEAPVCNLQDYAGLRILTKEQADNLIERVDVYGEGRIKIIWKFQDEYKDFL